MFGSGAYGLGLHAGRASALAGAHSIQVSPKPLRYLHGRPFGAPVRPCVYWKPAPLPPSEFASIEPVRSPRPYVVLLSIGVGVFVGIGVFTFIYAKGYSYLTNDPSACANCHIMNDHFSAWQKSSHRSVAVCNDCHTPSGILPKYITKADNGFWHSVAFTTGEFPDPIRIKPRNRRITEKTCMRCHQRVVDAIISGPHQTGAGPGSNSDEEGLSCVRCHAHVGHLVR